MGFFSRKPKGFFAFANGRSVAIEDVPDEVFATKMMGDGIAIIPSTGHIYAPCDGTITMVMQNTKHALGIKNKDGIEALIHIGLDTVNLSGIGFDVHVEAGDKVKAGDLLVTYDKDTFMKDGINDITMMVIVKPAGHTITKYYPDITVEIKTSKVLEYK